MSVQEATRTIRDPESAKRLTQACDMHLHVPPMHRGRQVWVRDELAKVGIEVSLETVRKWFAGEARPRPEKSDKLAEILGIDVAWLALGVDSGLSPRDRKVRSAIAGGVVNAIAGLIQLDGSYPAFPEESDVRATREHIDLYAIINRVNYAFHVALGEQRGNVLCLSVPAQTESAIILGVIRRGFSFEIYEITGEIIRDFGSRRGASSTVEVERGLLRRIEDFKARF